MAERGPDIGRMIQEELDKDPSGAQEGDRPLEISASGEIAERESSVEEEVDQAFEAIKGDGAETDEAAKQAELGGDYAQKVQQAFEKGDTKSLSSLVEDFKAKGGDTAVLREQLKGYHDAYQEAGLKEKAAEIDAFARSIEARGDVSTEGGKEFLAKLEAGEFGSLEEAINALDGLKEQAQGMDEDALADLNNEFNALFDAAQERFANANQEGEGVDLSDEDIDDVLGALG